ncbi:MAG: acyl carrier protein [Kiritimatiellae bacterium]|nr:acyl carrier protein [Kiritimatiellia bacterium]
MDVKLHFPSEKREDFFLLASEIFEVERSLLNENTRYGDVSGWDSVNHLRLVMEAERRFGVSYPLEKIPLMRTLADFFTI